MAATDTADADGSDDNSILYLLSGADAASFDIDSSGYEGQITVGASAKLDHETKDTYDGDGHGQGPGGSQFLR